MSDARAALRGLAFGAGAAVVLCVAAWLSPLAEGDRPVLALFAVTLSFPLGVALARVPATAREAGSLGLAALIAGLVLAIVVSVLDFGLFIRTASWCVSACLLGACIGCIGRPVGVAATCFWLVLNGLPFFYARLPLFPDTLELWALQGCPWLGFAEDALGGDPLKKSVLYFGHLTPLSDTANTGDNTLQPSTLWLAVVPAFASLIVTSIGRGRAEQDPAELERAGT